MTNNKLKKLWYKSGIRRWKIYPNQKYRDRLFRFLFRDKDNLLDLYNALAGTNFKDSSKLIIITLEDAIFMKMKNDLSFLIAGQLNLYEHQSTYNPNMPIRGLMYLAQQYEGLIEAGEFDIYGTTPVILPTPQYIVFYNGERKTEDIEELYLSDCFSEGRGSGCLECKCQVMNINRGHNKEILEKCRRLWEYSEFIAEIQVYLKKGYILKNAIQKAMDYCIERDILKDILLSQKAEVLHMLLTEYNEKRHLKNERELGIKEGRTAERKNTLREKQRADEAQEQANQEKLRAEEAAKLASQEKLRADEAAKLASQEKLRADEAAKLASQEKLRAEELTARLEEYRKKYGADI